MRSAHWGGAAEAKRGLSFPVILGMLPHPLGLILSDGSLLIRCGLTKSRKAASWTPDQLLAGDIAMAYQGTREALMGTGSVRVGYAYQPSGFTLTNLDWLRAALRKNPARWYAHLARTDPTRKGVYRAALEIACQLVDERPFTRWLCEESMMPSGAISRLAPRAKVEPVLQTALSTFDPAAWPSDPDFTVFTLPREEYGWHYEISLAVKPTGERTVAVWATEQDKLVGVRVLSVHDERPSLESQAKVVRKIVKQVAPPPPVGVRWAKMFMVEFASEKLTEAYQCNGGHHVKAVCTTVTHLRPHPLFHVYPLSLLHWYMPMVRIGYVKTRGVVLAKRIVPDSIRIAAPQTAAAEGYGRLQDKDELKRLGHGRDVPVDYCDEQGVLFRLPVLLLACDGILESLGAEYGTEVGPASGPMGSPQLALWPAHKIRHV